VVRLKVRHIDSAQKIIRVEQSKGRKDSVGKWVDVDSDGRYDVLEIETRGLKGPRTYEGTGMPFHQDNETVVKERLYLDKTNSDAHVLIGGQDYFLSWDNMLMPAKKGQAPPDLRYFEPRK